MMMGGLELYQPGFAGFTYQTFGSRGVVRRVVRHKRSVRSSRPRPQRGISKRTDGKSMRFILSVNADVSRDPLNLEVVTDYLESPSGSDDDFGRS